MNTYTEKKVGCGSNVSYKCGFNSQPVIENTYCTEDKTGVKYSDQDACKAVCARNHSCVDHMYYTRKLLPSSSDFSVIVIADLMILLHET